MHQYGKEANLQFNGELPNTGVSNPTGTFVLDLTDIKSTALGKSRYYLNLTNGSSGPVTIASSQLIDLVHNSAVTNSSQIPSTVNSTLSTRVSIDYDAVSGPVITTPPAVVITSPTNNAIINGDTLITINATSVIGIDHVNLYVVAAAKLQSKMNNFSGM
jgi:hypothetical protein